LGGGGLCAIVCTIGQTVILHVYLK